MLALRPSKKEEEHKLFQFFLAERRRSIHNTPSVSHLQHTIMLDTLHAPLLRVPCCAFRAV